MTKDEALRLALRKAFRLGQDYWFHADHEFSSYHKKADAIREKFDRLVEETIKQALEQPEPEPVAIAEGKELYWIAGREPTDDDDRFLYASPPKRKPLTDDELVQKMLDAGFERNSLGWTFTYGRLDYHLFKFARAIEAAHGIKGET